MKLPDFLTMWPFNAIKLTGHRIGLSDVVEAYQEGENAEQIHEHYPSLALELIQKVLDFYHANQAEVDAYVAACQEEAARIEASLPTIDWEQLQRRAEERKRAAGN